jgi:hypothetical protein
LLTPRFLATADGYPNRILPISIIKDQDFYLDEFVAELKPEQISYSVRLVNGHYVSSYPPGVALLAVPLYFIPVLTNALNSPVAITTMARIAAGILAALSAVFVYKILKRFIFGRWPLIITILYAFGTCQWAINSQDLWKHTGTQFLLTAAIYLLFSEKISKNKIMILGFVVASLITVKQLNIVFIGLISLYVFIQYRKYFWQYVLGAVTPALFFVLYNIHYLGTFSDIGYGEGIYNPLAVTSNTNPGNVLGAFFGQFISPARGMLFFSPVLVFAFIGMGLVFKKKNIFPTDLLLFLRLAIPLIVVYAFLVSRWITWWGGSVYGYRMVIDLLPFIILFFIPVIYSRFWQSKNIKGIFFVLLAFSVFVQFSGVIAWDESWYYQNNLNNNLDSKIFWSFADNPVFHYAKKFL